MMRDKDADRGDLLLLEIVKDARCYTRVDNDRR
jgi:hypothetical protein